MNYIFNESAVTFFLRGKRIKINKDHSQYPLVLKAFSLPVSQQEQAIEVILQEKEGLVKRDGFYITPEEVVYEGERLPKVLAKKIRALLKEGLPITLFSAFWANLRNNPASSSVRELYDFLSYKELPLTEDGCFLAYKGVHADGWSKNGNKSTTVLQGRVNDSGHIMNRVGDTIEVARRDVNDDRSEGCSWGLHVGSLAYAKGWASKVLLVKVNPADVVSVPTCSSFQKCRVSKYEILSEMKEEIMVAATDEKGAAIKATPSTELSDFDARMVKYLEKQEDLGATEVRIRKIQNSFSPTYPSREEVLASLDRLNMIWLDKENVGFVVEL